MGVQLPSRPLNSNLQTERQSFVEVAITDITNVEKEIQFQVTAVELQPHFEKAYKREQSKIEIKGFRKGKAPLDMIKKIYGESIEYDSLSDIAGDFYRKAVEERSLEPVGDPVLVDINYKRGTELSFKIKYEVKPQFNLQEYKGVAVEKIIHTVTQQEVQDELLRLRRANSTTAETQTASDDEHILTVDAQEVDQSGTPLIGKKNPDMRVYLADESVNPEIKRVLQGTSVGETRRATIEQDHGDHKHTQQLAFAVKKIEKVELPEVNDEFVKKLSKDKVQTVADFETDIKKDLERYWNESSDRAMMDSLIGEIVRRHDFIVPESLAKAVTDGFLTDLAGRYPNKKMPHDFDEKKFREEYRPSALYQAKWFLIRERITEEEKLTVDDADLTTRAELDAPQMGIEKERLMQFYKNSQSVKDRILTDKLFSLLKTSAKISEINESDVKKSDEIQK